MKFNQLKTPCYVIDEKKLKQNLILLNRLEKETGCHVLLAQKAFSYYPSYPLIGTYISGTTASGLYEARLGYEEMKMKVLHTENHVFCPGYKEEEMKELDEICDHLVFNSLTQYKKLHGYCKHASIGLRINPECSTQDGHAIYDPCAPFSRLGIRIDEFDKAPAGTVLLAQINSGGTGLNIQSASVVIICEPQFKPSIENQAISRAYRMGQTRNVLVYRLLCEDSIDEQMMKMLNKKQNIFNEFADKSSAKDTIEINEETFNNMMKVEYERVKNLVNNSNTEKRG